MVEDESMLPSFVPGDRLLIDPRVGRPLRPGDVVAVRDPEQEGRLLLKRVRRLEVVPSSGGALPGPDLVFVEGDNADRSRDSRQFGPIARDRIVGVAWYRYAPAGRRGRIELRQA